LNGLHDKRKLAGSRNQGKDDLVSSKSGRNANKPETTRNLGAQEAHQRYVEERKEKEKLDQEIVETTQAVEQLRSQYLSSIATVHRLEREISDIKPEIRCITKKQLEFYYALLAEGKETRGYGLSWVIKTIWYLKGNVTADRFPKPLDPESINYLIETSKLSLERAELIKKLKNVKMVIYSRRKDSNLVYLIVSFYCKFRRVSHRVMRRRS